MTKRAKGSNAKLRIAEETTYGTAAASGFVEVPFASYGNSAEQGLVASELLGLGRDPAPPSQDVINVGGQAVVPIDLRNIGHWLKYAVGKPLSRPVRATGTLTFSGQPANGSSITLNGTAWTFVTGSPSGAQTQIGASLADTLADLATDLNASADANIDDATYTANATTLTVTSKTWAGGNAFTLAAGTSPATNATRSGATLTGGGYEHRYRSGGPRTRGKLTFSSNPGNGSTISIGGTTWTFTTGTAGSGETKVQGTLAATLALLVEDLAASVDANLVKASYGASATELTVELKAGGLQAAFAIQGSAGSNSTPTTSTALTLADELPSFTAESALPDTGNFFVTVGNKIGSLALSFERSGNAQATLQVMGQGESEHETTQAGTPTTLDLTRLSQFQGAILAGGVAVATVTGATMAYSNNLDPVPTIRSDGKIDGFDDGVASASGRIDARFSDSTTLRDAAGAGTPVDVTMGYTRSAHEKLIFNLPAVYLPQPKREINGPTGIQASFDYQGSKSTNWMMETTLRNDVAGY